MADLFNIAGKVAKEKLEPAGPQISIMSISGLPAIFRDKGGRISINGQDHSLAWINPKEKRILKGIGGSGEEWNEFLQRITTHEIKYGKYEPDGKSPDRKFVYKRISKFEEKSGRHTVELVKKNTNFV